jgi:hypothetical protein
MSNDKRPSYDRRPTRPMPRVALAPIAPVSDDVTILDVSPEERAALLRAQEEDLRATLVPCPQCERCATCNGLHSVPPRVRDEFLHALNENDDEPPPEAA